MGLIRAALVGAATTLADTWEEFFVCDSIPADVIVVRGKKQLGKHSSNKKGNENVISDGSSIVVHEGQVYINMTPVLHQAFSPALSVQD